MDQCVCVYVRMNLESSAKEGAVTLLAPSRLTLNLESATLNLGSAVTLNLESFAKVR